MAIRAKPARPKRARRATAKAKAKAKTPAKAPAKTTPRRPRPAKLKTTPSDASVSKFLAKQPAQRRAECATLVALLSRITRDAPRLWGASIVGFGAHRYHYASGRTGEWMRVGFAPRATSLTIYLTSGVDGMAGLLGRLGKHTTGKACVYVRRLADIDLTILARVVRASLAKLAA